MFDYIPIPNTPIIYIPAPGCASTSMKNWIWEIRGNQPMAKYYYIHDHLIPTQTNGNDLAYEEIEGCTFIYIYRLPLDRLISACCNLTRFFDPAPDLNSMANLLKISTKNWGSINPIILKHILPQYYTLRQAMKYLRPYRNTLFQEEDVTWISTCLMADGYSVPLIQKTNRSTQAHKNLLTLNLDPQSKDIIDDFYKTETDYMLTLSDYLKFS